jgi:hypothetical protein
VHAVDVPWPIIRGSRAGEALGRPNSKVWCQNELCMIALLSTSMWEFRDNEDSKPLATHRPTAISFITIPPSTSQSTACSWRLTCGKSRSKPALFFFIEQRGRRGLYRGLYIANETYLQPSPWPTGDLGLEQINVATKGRRARWR